VGPIREEIGRVLPDCELLELGYLDGTGVW
jgi:hypothetical protein